MKKIEFVISINTYDILLLCSLLSVLYKMLHLAQPKNYDERICSSQTLTYGEQTLKGLLIINAFAHDCNLE